MLNAGIFRRLLKEHILPYKSKIFIAMLCMIVAAMTTAANAYMIKPVLDDIFLKQNASLIPWIAAAILFIGLAKGISAYFQNITLKFIGQRVIADLQLRLYKHLLYADIAQVFKESSGRLISRFTNDIQLMRDSVSMVITGITREIITIIGLLTVMIYQDKVLSFFALIVFPIAIYPIIRLGKRMRRIAGETQKQLGNYVVQLDETLHNIKNVKAFQQERFEYTRAEKIINSILKLYIKAARTESLSSPIMELLSSVAVIIVIIYGGMQIINGVTTTGSFFSFLGALIMAYKPLKSIIDLNNNFQQGMAAATRLYELFDTEPQIIDKKDITSLVINKGSVKFENISLCYPNREKWAIHNVSFSIQGGTIAAFVGTSGGGKSSIINLLLRFYEPNAGKIYIDGHDINHVTLSSLREAISFVGQDITLFDDSIGANIAYGKLDATQEEIEKAAQMANIHETIVMLPEGYDTLIGQSGSRLSGGQRQRLAIARALIKNAPIIIFDESTSALDNHSEKMLKQTFNYLKAQKKTLIIIAHRLSTIEDADQIFVIGNGEILESGTHDKLITDKGYYHKLHQLHT